MFKEGNFPQKMPILKVLSIFKFECITMVNTRIILRLEIDKRKRQNRRQFYLFIVLCLFRTDLSDLNSGEVGSGPKSQVLF
jgi:hypothetical protein